MIQPITFFVHGKPQPAGSKRAFVIKGRAVITDANKHSKDWKTDVRHVALNEYNGDILTMPLSVKFTFLVDRPTGHYGTGKNAFTVKQSAPIAPATKPDVLKLSRGVEDALTGVIWKDDAQIVDERITKRYCEKGESPGVYITVWEYSKLP